MSYLEKICNSIGVSLEYWNCEMHPAERSLVERFVKISEKIRWINKNVLDENKRQMKPTNDFIWRGMEWELKSALVPPKYRTLKNKIEKAAKQGKVNIMCDFLEHSVSNKLISLLERYNLYNEHKIENLVLYINDKIVEVDLKK